MTDTNGITKSMAGMKVNGDSAPLKSAYVPPHVRRGEAPTYDTMLTRLNAN